MASGRDRNHERVNAEVPVLTESGAKGITRDMSPTGVYFTVGERVRVGETIRFSMDFEAPLNVGGVFRLACVGTVTRVESRHGKTGVAVAITESTLERLRDRSSARSTAFGG